MKNLKVSLKLIISFGIVLLLSVLISISGIVGMMFISNGINNFYGYVNNITSSMTILNRINESAKNMLYACMTEDYEETKRRLEMTEECFDVIDEYFVLLEKSYNGDATKVTNIRDNINSIKSTFDKFKTLCLENKDAEAFDLYTAEIVDVLIEASDNMREIRDVSNVEADDVYSNEKNLSYTLILIMIIVSIISIIIGITFATYITKIIVRPIREVNDAALKMSNGDFEIDIEYEAEDELGELANSMRFMIDKIKTLAGDSCHMLQELANGDFTVESRAAREYVGVFVSIKEATDKLRDDFDSTLGQISKSADKVSSGAQQVSAGAQSLSQGATEQAASIEELAATINEISSKIKSNTEYTKNASEKITYFGNEISTSNKHMQDMTEAMDKISTSSSEIGNIIKTIEDIAFQTNILSLNAAVEAARAGDAGKGFAVVAEEVRNLAGRSAEAARNTTELIETALNAVSGGKKIADITAKSLVKVVEEAEEVISIVEKISIATNEQSESISQVTVGVDQISSVVQTNSAAAQESAAISQELADQSHFLKRLVERFKLSEKNSLNMSGSSLPVYNNDNYNNSYDNYDNYDNNNATISLDEGKYF